MKRERSTFVSAATTTASAAATSSVVSTFLAPTDPCVSTLIQWPMPSAALRRPSAAMNVWAIPVGHDVMATTRFWPSPAAGIDAGSASGSDSGSATSGSAVATAAASMTS